MISAVVPVWNGRDLLERLLATLAAQTIPAGELLVVDNGSTDGAPELAVRHGARVISMGRNAGFAAAVNRGIAESRGEWVAVLNSDVELAPDYLARLLDAGGWFATGKILRRGEPLIDATGDAVCRAGIAWRVGNGRPDGPRFAERRAISSPPWTAALFRAALFRQAGSLEESFESYLEDVDFGLRCAALGITGWYVPEAVAWHRGSATLGEWHPDTVRRMARNQVLLLARHYSSEALMRCWWPVVAGHLLWGALACRHGRGVAWLRGKVQGIESWQQARRGQFDPGLVERARTDERLIREVQHATGWDAYWRFYFLLTGGGA